MLSLRERHDVAAPADSDGTPPPKPSAVSVFGSAVSATVLGTGIASVAAGLGDLFTDPLTSALLGDAATKSHFYKLLHSILSASVMVIVAWAVSVATTKGGWGEVWNFIAPVKTGALATGADDTDMSAARAGD